MKGPSDNIIRAIPALSLISAILFLLIMVWDDDIFLWLTIEDGILEWLTFCFMALAAFIASFIVFKVLSRDRKLDWFFLLFALGCIVVSGEEISWGQRIFSIHTPSTLEKINDQNELTLHNINIDGVDVGYIVGKAERILLTAYFLFLPIICFWSEPVKKVLSRAGFFIPPLSMILTYLAAVLLPISIKIWGIIGTPTEVATSYNPEILEFFIGVICIHVAFLQLNMIAYES